MRCPTDEGCYANRIAAGLATLIAGLVLGSVAIAAPPGPRDPDWPCMSIKVPELSLGALWAGPPIAGYEKTWAQQNDVAQLAVRLAQRRLPLKQAQAEVETFAKSAGSDRDSKLLALVAGLFDTLNSQRSSVIAGLDRFGARQKELANQIRTQLDTLHAMQAATDQDTTRIAALGEQLQWETRLFEERRDTTQYVCAVPDLIEQRFFALARTIQQNLSSG